MNLALHKRAAFPTPNKASLLQLSTSDINLFVYLCPEGPIPVVSQRLSLALERRSVFVKVCLKKAKWTDTAEG